jgi:hypothetical protein
MRGKDIETFAPQGLSYPATHVLVEVELNH